MHANWDEGDANSETSYAIYDSTMLIIAEVSVVCLCYQI